MKGYFARLERLGCTGARHLTDQRPPAGVALFTFRCMRDDCGAIHYADENGELVSVEGRRVYDSKVRRRPDLATALLELVVGPPK